jgi:hypothetical protein
VPTIPVPVRLCGAPLADTDIQMPYSTPPDKVDRCSILPPACQFKYYLYILLGDPESPLDQFSGSMHFHSARSICLMMFFI